MIHRILITFMFFAVAQTACAPYTWRTEVSDPTREPLLERAEQTHERDPQLPKLTGEVGVDRIDLQVQVEDQCRDKTTTPIGEVVRTQRTLDEPVWSTFAAVGVATAIFVAPAVAFSSCRGSSCGIDNGDAFDTWRTTSYLALGAVALAYGVWGIAASHDSKAVTVVDKTESFSDWRSCQGKLPVGDEVAVVIRHKDGSRMPVGTAKLDAGGRATLALPGAEQAFAQHGDGEVFAMLDKVTAELGCGAWGPCKQAQHCATVRAKIPGFTAELEKQFGRWRSAESDRDGNGDGASLIALLDRVHQMATLLADGAPDCPESERQIVNGRWRIVFNEMRVDRLAGLRIPALDVLARDVRTGVRWATVSDPYHEVAAQWLARLPADIAGYKVAVIQRCGQIAKDLNTKKKAAKWQAIESASREAIAACTAAPARPALVELQHWALEAGCRTEKTREHCAAACDAGGQAGCQVVARMDEAERRNNAGVEAAERREVVQALQRVRRQFIRICPSHFVRECVNSNPYASLHFCRLNGRQRFMERLQVIDIVIAALKSGSESSGGNIPSVENLSVYDSFPCLF